MELRQLKYFVTVAEELNFRRAAKRLYMQQSPLSRQIRQLENELGVELFNRSRRGTALTKAGQAFLDEARLTLAQAERARLSVQQALQGEKLSIGFSICAFDRVLPEIIQVFRQEFPDAIVTLAEMSSKAQIEALLNKQIDIGFVHAPVFHSDILTLTLLREPLVVALSSAHPLAHQEKIDLRLLANEAFILFPESVKPELYSQIMQLCEQAGFQPHVIQEATPPEVLLGFVALGIGVTLVAAGAEARYSTRVVYRPLVNLTSVVEIDVAWHKNSASHLLKDFLALIVATQNKNHSDPK